MQEPIGRAAQAIKIQGYQAPGSNDCHQYSEYYSRKTFRTFFSVLACLAGGQVGLRRSDFVGPIGATKAERLCLGQSRSSMGEEVRLTHVFGLCPVGRSEPHTVKQQQ